MTEMELDFVPQHEHNIETDLGLDSLSKLELFSAIESKYNIKIDDEHAGSIITVKNIEELIASNNIFLFMKGNKDQPQCGFSKQVIEVLHNLTNNFSIFDILSDNDIREGIKEYSQWPTIPQLYIKGEFVGGCDIITEMTLSGELDTLFETNGVSYDKDAADKIRESNG